MAAIPKWVKQKKERLCRKCGGTPLTDVHRKHATYWCGACGKIWTVRRNAHGDLRVRYFTVED